MILCFGLNFRSTRRILFLGENMTAGKLGAAVLSACVLTRPLQNPLQRAFPCVEKLSHVSTSEPDQLSIVGRGVTDSFLRFVVNLLSGMSICSTWMDSWQHQGISQRPPTRFSRPTPSGGTFFVTSILDMCTFCPLLNCQCWVCG